MLLDFAQLNLNAKENLYLQLYSFLSKAIKDGVIKKGERLPSVREAAAQLGVSRTTVENAYSRLCIEGFCESLPQRGYFVTDIPKKRQPIKESPHEKKDILYDFSGKLVDKDISDIALWKKLIRSVLWDTDELNSYGDPQGELCLRQTLVNYSYKARGVAANADNIIIGAGVGPLLNILCGLLGRNLTVGFENGGFSAAERIFKDYGIKTFKIASDNSGGKPRDIEDTNPDILFLIPSALPKISPNTLLGRRVFFKEWAEKNNRIIIEDDYNGELRYTARSIPAFQNKAPDNTVYIGSFSKLLLPSVRIAYMVLPDPLAVRFKEYGGIYNQTCGKIEQLALEKYIVTGALEKQLRKLRRIYYTKSQALCEEIKNSLTDFKSLTLFESSLTVEVTLKREIDSDLFIKSAEKWGVKTADLHNNKALRLSFSGIEEEKIPEGIRIINKILRNL